MKSKISALMLFPISVSAFEVDWNKWFQERTAEFESAMKLPETERIPLLGPSVSKGPIDYQQQLEGVRLESYLRTQHALISIPGHAKYYDKRIREAYADLRDPALPRYIGAANRVQSEMGFGLKVLCQLPSPETVKVLGEMLSEEWRHPVTPGDEYIPPALAVASVHALAALPFQEPPTPPFYWHLAQEKLPIWQKWYAEVKSGSRTFSFKGQTVEYRFKPDGIWDNRALANLPDDAPKPAVAAASPEKRTPPSQKSKTSPPQGPPWAWLIGAAAAVLSALVWMVLKKSRSHAG